MTIAFWSGKSLGICSLSEVLKPDIVVPWQVILARNVSVLLINPAKKFPETRLLSTDKVPAAETRVRDCGATVAPAGGAVQEVHGATRSDGDGWQCGEGSESFL